MLDDAFFSHSRRPAAAADEGLAKSLHARGNARVILVGSAVRTRPRARPKMVRTADPTDAFPLAWSDLVVWLAVAPLNWRRVPGRRELTPMDDSLRTVANQLRRSRRRWGGEEP